mgnify:FL=1|tara:strand:- start:225 stop:401 length:177 start_codon:yes stop_codon:yes gene_type:complete
MPSIEFIGVSSDDESGDEFRKEWSFSIELPDDEVVEEETSEPINLEEFQRCMRLFKGL